MKKLYIHTEGILSYLDIIIKKRREKIDSGFIELRNRFVLKKFRITLLH